MKEYKTYEAAKKRLDEIAVKMEDKSISLDKSMELYEEASKLIAVCYEKLKAAELKFSEISVESAED